MHSDYGEAMASIATASVLVVLGIAVFLIFFVWAVIRSPRHCAYGLKGTVLMLLIAGLLIGTALAGFILLGDVLHLGNIPSAGIAVVLAYLLPLPLLRRLYTPGQGQRIERLLIGGVGLALTAGVIFWLMASAVAATDGQGDFAVILSGQFGAR
jgi:hypothetical protein